MLFVNQISFGGAFRRIRQQRHAFYSIEDSSVHRRHSREFPSCTVPLGIVVPSKNKLPAVIDTLISAVRAGELDDLFNQAAKTGSIGNARKAA